MGVPLTGLLTMLACTLKTEWMFSAVITGSG